MSGSCDELPSILKENVQLSSENLLLHSHSLSQKINVSPKDKHWGNTIDNSNSGLPNVHLEIMDEHQTKVEASSILGNVLPELIDTLDQESSHYPHEDDFVVSDDEPPGLMYMSDI